MADNVTRELLAMVVRIGAIAAILGAFYATVGLGGQAQTLAIGAAAAFGSQAAAFTARRIAGDRRVKPLVIAIFAALALAATIYIVVSAPGPKAATPRGYDATVAELSRGGADRHQRDMVRVLGAVVAGSRTDAGFAITEVGATQPTWRVRLPGSPPAVVQDGARVIVTGVTKFDGGAWTLVATTVVAP